MGLFDGCILASDIDGTLVTNIGIPQRNIDLISYFTDEGGIFSISTGRSPSAAYNVTKFIPQTGPSIFTNGSVIYDCMQKEILHQFFLDSDSLKAVNSVLNTGLSVGIQLHTADNIYVVSENRLLLIHLKYENITADNCDIQSAQNMPVNKVLYLLDDQDKVKDVTVYLNSLNLNCDFFNSGANMFGKFYAFIEQVPKNVDKAYGLKYLADRLKIKNSKIFAIGDYYNDASMIKAAGIGAVAGQAPDDLKIIADYVSCDVSQGAVADFIEHLAKIMRRG